MEENDINVEDWVLRQEFQSRRIEDWVYRKELIRRQFSVMVPRTAPSQCELLSLSLVNFEHMSTNFLKAYDYLMTVALKRLRRMLKVKLLAIKHCNHPQNGGRQKPQNTKENVSIENNNLSSFGSKNSYFPDEQVRFDSIIVN